MTRRVSRTSFGTLYELVMWVENHHEKARFLGKILSLNFRAKNIKLNWTTFINFWKKLFFVSKKLVLFLSRLDPKGWVMWQSEVQIHVHENRKFNFLTWCFKVSNTVQWMGLLQSDCQTLWRVTRRLLPVWRLNENSAKSGKAIKILVKSTKLCNEEFS